MSKADIIVTAMRRIAEPSDRGPFLYATTLLEGSRYAFDTVEFLESGWQQWDTSSDAWYFGVWVNATTREILTFAEGDLSLCIYADATGFAEAIDRMAEFHGEPPPAFVVLDLDAGKRTDYIDHRLTGAQVLAEAAE